MRHYGGIVSDDRKRAMICHRGHTTWRMVLAAYFLSLLLGQTRAVADEEAAVAGEAVDSFPEEEEDGLCGGEGMSCEVWEALGPPPDFLHLPPPPVPVWMEESVQRLRQASGQCLLCSWASNNHSLLLADGESTAAPWIPILVAVALLSALLGAIAMVVVIRCRRWRVLPSKGLCPLVGMDRAKETSAPPLPASKPPGGRGGGGGPSCLHERPRGWGGRLWQRSGSQEQSLRSPASVLDSEHSYTEHPYTCPDQESAVYAELNSVSASQGVPAYRTYMMNTYSEIGEPRLAVPRRLLPDGTYENAGYVLEPAGGGESGSGSGSGSNHSSAYYSDVSAGEPAVVLSAAGGSQRRRRRDGELGGAAARLPVPRQCPRRVPVNLLPDAGDIPENLENPPPESTMIAATRKGSHYHGLDNQTLSVAGRLAAPPETCGLPLTLAVRTAPFPAAGSRRELPLNASFRSDPDSGQRSGDSGNRSGSEQGSLDRARQLPLLPSRRLQGPQKRGVYTLATQAEPSPPTPPPPPSSEYV